MYLTGGQYKGSKIEAPKSARPTLSKVRESVFNILMAYAQENSSFLDMFAGSGIMGLEALSRGYKVKEIEINSKNAELIKKNYAKIKKKPDLTKANALNYKTETKFDIIYIDPPWQADYSTSEEETEQIGKIGMNNKGRKLCVCKRTPLTTCIVYQAREQTMRNTKDWSTVDMRMIF